MQQLLPQRTSWNSGFFFEPCNQAVSFINLACFKFLFTFKVTCTPYCEITLNHVLHVFSPSSSSSSLYLQSVNGFSICIYSLIRDCPHLVLGYRHKMLLCSHFEYLIYDCVHSYSILPCQMPLWNMSLAARTKQWTAPNLQKLCVHRDPVLTSVPEYKVTQAQAPCLNSSVGT